jgi:hypothetical protein
MTTLRKIFTTALAVTALSVVASATTITIGYTSSTFGPTTTDITNQTLSLPGFDPGSANSTTSDISGNGYTTGISMSSLNTGLTGMTYTLTGYNISVMETLSGSFTITNNSTTSDATGSAYIDTYTAVSLTGALSPGLSNNVDPANDLYNCSVTEVGANHGSCTFGNNGEQATSLGGGPDPNAPAASGLDIAENGGTYNSGAINVNSRWVDLACEITNSEFCHNTAENTADNTLLSSNYGLVSGSPTLTADFSTATQSDTSLTGGDNTTTYATSVSEIIEVTYQIDEEEAPTTPEPTTMALVGGALLGLGLMRKRLKKS